MNEAILPSPTISFAVTKTYSLTMEHIGKVADLSARLGISQGEVVRRAIDLLYQRIGNIEAETELELNRNTTK